MKVNYRQISGSENTFKEYLVRTMGTRWDVQSHEDRYSTGVPDLSFGVDGINGWIELKYRREWPAQCDTPVKFKRFTPSQVSWLRKRGKKGGHCYVMAQIATEYFVFSFHEARSLRAGITRKEYGERCLQSWKGTISPEELKAVLVRCH